MRQTLIPLDAPPVILTGEYIPENFLLSREGDRWRLSGLFDFGDVMTGWGEYDLLGPSAFMTAGMPRRVRSLLEGFGYSDADINPALQRRLMALMLLHRVSDPIGHICIEGWQHKAGDLFELQELLWPERRTSIARCTKGEQTAICAYIMRQICRFVCNANLLNAISIVRRIAY